jgi:hypothetical protein
MKRPHRANDGYYYIKGQKFKELFGSREQVWNGTAYKTAGELVRSQLMMNKWGRIVSKDKFLSSKKENRLLKYGYGSRKGKFGYVLTKKHKRGNKRRSLRRRNRIGGGGDGDVEPSAQGGAPAGTEMQH